MRDENSLYWIWLAERCGAESSEFIRLIERYENPFDLYRLEDEETEHLEGISSALKSRLCDKALDSSYSILRYCRENKVDVITYADKRYPQRLKLIETPPVVLYCMGKLPDLNKRLCVGMVGTRKMSEYGKQSAYKISYELASANAVIVSGMALGVDAVSACGAMEAGGDTVAVLGCGISVVYPKEHKKLMGEIGRKGAIITEYPPMERPNARNFPRRNRIISGLSQGVIIIEGDMRSGALITASRAIAQGREVFALPGKINESNSDGPNELIRNGANVVLSSDDILNFYDFLYHGVINYKGHTRAKRVQSDVDGTLAKYGASGVCYKGRYESCDSLGNDVTLASDLLARQEIIPEKKAKKQERVPDKKEEASADNSAEILASLDDKCRAVFENMPIDKAVSVDALADCGVSVVDIVTAFTILEVSGLIASLPGGLYIRK